VLRWRRERCRAPAAAVWLRGAAPTRQRAAASGRDCDAPDRVSHCRRTSSPARMRWRVVPYGVGNAVPAASVSPSSRTTVAAARRQLSLPYALAPANESDARGWSSDAGVVVATGAAQQHRSGGRRRLSVGVAAGRQRRLCESTSCRRSSRRRLLSPASALPRLSFAAIARTSARVAGVQVQASVDRGATWRVVKYARRRLDDAVQRVDSTALQTSRRGRRWSAATARRHWRLACRSGWLAIRARRRLWRLVPAARRACALCLARSRTATPRSSCGRACRSPTSRVVDAVCRARRAYRRPSTTAPTTTAGADQHHHWHTADQSHDDELRRLPDGVRRRHRQLVPLLLHVAVLPAPMRPLGVQS
jgi:hypothetical protein